MAERYPLAWPDAFSRATKRESGQFRTTLGAALKNVEASLQAFSKDSGKGVSNIVLSSNVALGHEKPDDPGVAAWFVWDGQPICIPVDRYTTPAANLQAIHHVLEARRTEMRHGTLALVRATMKGFLALPAPPWRDLLELSGDATVEDVEKAFRCLAAKRHPDRPSGSHDAMAALTAARDTALKQLEAQRG